MTSTAPEAVQVRTETSSDRRRVSFTWFGITKRIEEDGSAPRGVKVFGIPRGGIHVAQILAKVRGCKVVDDPLDAEFIVDDLRDSGRTMRQWSEDYPHAMCWTPFDIREERLVGKWIVFPWEKWDERSDAEEAAARILQALGQDVSPGTAMEDTPERWAKSLRELTAGYHEDPKEILSKRFRANYDEMIVVRDIEFWSLCEHHILPFHGRATVGYIPQHQAENAVVGLSKIARLVHCFARRFQIQERLTKEIAEAMEEILQPRGVGVVLHATHLCMAARGVRTPADMVTSDLRGAMREPEVRAEFLSLERPG